MNDYELQQELEALAGNAFNPSLEDDSEHAQPEPMSRTIARWQKLFNMNQDTAIDRIIEHRNNLTRPRISDAHWDIVREEKEAQGYDREAYEFELDLQKRKAMLPELVPVEDENAEDNVMYLVEISGLLDTKEKVWSAAGMDGEPVVVSGISAEDRRKVALCCVDAAGKAAVLKWAGEEGGGFEPTILVDPRSLR